MPPRRSARLAMKPRVNFRAPGARALKYTRVNTKQRLVQTSACSRALITLNYVVLFALSLTLTTPFIVHLTRI
jgi:hypothetical protein